MHSWATSRAMSKRRAERAGAAPDVIADDRLATVFAALGDPTRLKLVTMLCAGAALSIAQLTANTAISRQAVTKHLQVLADAGVVHDIRSGRERLWQLDPAQVEAAKKALEIIGREWEAALGRLKTYVESEGAD